MEAYDAPLLQSMKQAGPASDPLAVALLKWWDDEFSRDFLAHATTALGGLWHNEDASVMLFAGAFYGACCSLCHLWARF